MKRMKVLFGQRRVMVLVTLTILVLAAAALAASSASFTATSANPGNVFTSGALTIGNYQADGTTNNAGNAIVSLSATNPRPGGPATSGTAVIENTGSVSGVFSLNGAVNAGGGTTGYPVTYDPFAAWLRLTVVEDPTGANRTIVNDLPLSTAFPTAINLTQGLAWAPTAAHTYVFSVRFPDGADTIVNDFMNRSATFDFTWRAVSN
jgi:hypothetical protein